MDKLEKRLKKHIDLLVERYPSLEHEKNSIISAYLLLEECYEQSVRFQEGHHHHGSRCNCCDSWANDTRYDACRAIHHRTAQLTSGATDELLLFSARCED